MEWTEKVCVDQSYLVGDAVYHILLYTHTNDAIAFLVTTCHPQLSLRGSEWGPRSSARIEKLILMIKLTLLEEQGRGWLLVLTFPATSPGNYSGLEL